LHRDRPGGSGSGMGPAEAAVIRPFVATVTVQLVDGKADQDS
jgi:hypothetical protein